MKLRLGRIPAHYFIFVSSLALFLFSLQRNFSAAHDSITYLNHIVEGNNLFHPHHLLYNFVARCWLLTGQILFPGAADYILIEMLSALFGSALLTVCFLFFRNRSKLTAAFSSIATAVIAFSFGVWSYSSNIEVYAPPLFFSMLVLYTITHPVLTNNKIFLAAIYTSCAILFHQVHVLLFLVSFIYLAQKINKERRFQLMTHFVLPSILFTGLVYILVAFTLAGVSNIPDFFDWVTLYAHGHDYWRSPGFMSILLVITGFIHAFFGGHFLFRLPFQSLSSSSFLQGHNLADEKYLVRNMESWQAVLLTLLMVFASILIVKFFSNYIRHRGYKHPILRPLHYTFIVYSCFFFFWMPENLEFWILQTILFWIIVFSTYQPSQIRRVKIGASLIAACLFIINFGGSMFWLLEKDNDWYYSAVKPLIPTATSADLVITKNPWIMSDYVSRFTHCRQPVNDNGNNILIDIKQAVQSGKRVFVIDAQDPESGESKKMDSLLQSFSMRMKLFDPGLPKIEVIR